MSLRIFSGASVALMLAVALGVAGCSSEDSDQLTGGRHRQRTTQGQAAESGKTGSGGHISTANTPPTPEQMRASVRNGVPVPGGIADNAVQEVKTAADAVTTQVAAGDRVAAVQAVLAASQKVAGNLGVNGVPAVNNLRTIEGIKPVAAGDAAVAAVGDLEAAVKEVIANIGAGDAAAAVQAILDACANIAPDLGVNLPGNIQLPGLPAGTGGLPIPDNGAGEDDSDGAGAGGVLLLDCAKLPALIRPALQAAGKCAG